MKDVEITTPVAIAKTQKVPGKTWRPPPTPYSPHKNSLTRSSSPSHTHTCTHARTRTHTCMHAHQYTHAHQLGADRPLAPSSAFGFQVAETVGLVPIMRAGLGMVDAFVELLANSHVRLANASSCSPPDLQSIQLPPTPRWWQPLPRAIVSCVARGAFASCYWLRGWTCPECSGLVGLAHRPLPRSQVAMADRVRFTSRCDGNPDKTARVAATLVNAWQRLRLLDWRWSLLPSYSRLSIVGALAAHLAHCAGTSTSAPPRTSTNTATCWTRCWRRAGRRSPR